MKNLTGLIARCASVRHFRLVASIIVVVMVAPGLFSLCAGTHTPVTTGPVGLMDIAGWTAEAGFAQPAVLLSDKDRAIYHRIFALQAAGQWRAAEPLLAALDDPLLVGHVLYQRYMVDPTYKSNFAELNGWLQDFGDQPNADKVYRLAMRRRAKDDVITVEPKITAKAVTPLSRLVNLAGRETDQTMALQSARMTTKAADKLANQIRQALNRNLPAKALVSLNEGEKNLTETQRGVLLTQIAMGYYQTGKYSYARQVAQRAARLRGTHDLIASWISGLAAWQLHDYGAAKDYFAQIADSHQATRLDPWFYSAGAFWAARAAGRQGDQAGREMYLQKAGLYPTTFYGVLAHGALGREFQPTAHHAIVSADDLDDNDLRILAEQPIGERVLALLDINQTALAAQELQQWLASATINDNEPLQQAIAALATRYGLDDVARQLRQADANNPYLQAVYRNDTLFPVLQDAMTTSENVDPALIHALIRQESRFDPKARNKTTGASGLMQLMPETAKFIGETKSMDGNALLDPKTNLRLGQRYVDYLLRQPYVKGNLFYLAVAYNAGPGNLQNWQQTNAAKDDPLLFIESIPFGQTRHFVEHVMANYWMYRLRMGQGAPDVQALLDGAWPQHAVQQPANKALPVATTKTTVPKNAVIKDALVKPEPAKPKQIEDARLNGRFDLAMAE